MSVDLRDLHVLPHSFPPRRSSDLPFIWGGLVVGFMLAMVTVFKSNWCNITAPMYAIAEGFALGGLSAYFELRFNGIVIQAVGLRSEEHTSELQSLMRISYAVFCLKKKIQNKVQYQQYSQSA